MRGLTSVTLAIFVLGAPGCGNLVREAPPFAETNRIVRDHLDDLPSDGLQEYMAPDSAGAVTGRYLVDRLLDTIDLFGLSFLGGYGIGVNARATKAFQAGGGWYRASGS